jgi:hypothetical protein
MTVFFAHHIEPHHVPVLLGLAAAGFWIGWNFVSRWVARRARRTETVAERQE